MLPQWLSALPLRYFMAMAEYSICQPVSNSFFPIGYKKTLESLFKSFLLLNNSFDFIPKEVIRIFPVVSL